MRIDSAKRRVVRSEDENITDVVTPPANKNMALRVGNMSYFTYGKALSYESWLTVGNKFKTFHLAQTPVHDNACWCWLEREGRRWAKARLVDASVSKVVDRLPRHGVAATSVARWHIVAKFTL